MDLDFDFTTSMTVDLDEEFREWYLDFVIGAVSEIRAKDPWTLKLERMKKNAVRPYRIVWTTRTREAVIRVNTHMSYPEMIRLRLFGPKPFELELSHWKELIAISSGFIYSFMRWPKTITKPKAYCRGVRWLSEWLIFSGETERGEELSELLRKLGREE